jgi:hypothetical protein
MAGSDFSDDVGFSMESIEDDDGSMVSDGSSGSYLPALSEQLQNAEKTAVPCRGPGQIAGSATTESSRDNAEESEVTPEPRLTRHLNLLDLPIEVLKDIVKEVSSTWST